MKLVGISPLSIFPKIVSPPGLAVWAKSCSLAIFLVVTTMAETLDEQRFPLDLDRPAPSGPRKLLVTIVLMTGWLVDLDTKRRPIKGNIGIKEDSRHGHRINTPSDGLWFTHTNTMDNSESSYDIRSSPRIDRYLAISLENTLLSSTSRRALNLR